MAMEIWATWICRAAWTASSLSWAFQAYTLRISKKKSFSLPAFGIFVVCQLVLSLVSWIQLDADSAFGHMMAMFTGGIAFYFLHRNQRLEEQAISCADIIQQLPGHVYWKDREGVILGCNQQSWLSLGLKSSADCIGKIDHDILEEEIADRVAHIDRQVIRTGKLLITEELANIKGKEEFFLSHKAPLKNYQGKIIGVIGTSLNITEKRRQELERQALLEDIIASMPGHVYWIDRNHVIQGANDNQARSAGLTNWKELVGKRNRDLPWSKGRQDWIQQIDNVSEEVMRTGQARVLEETCHFLDDSEAVFRSSKVPLRNQNDEVVGMLGVSVDITDIKCIEAYHREKSEAANKAKTEFLSNMRHDLRTPFCGLLGFSESLLSKEKDVDKRKQLGYIVDSAKELLNQINEILEFSQAEQGSLPILDQRFEFSELIDAIIKIIKPTTEQKKLRLTLIQDSSIPDFLIGDRVRTQRILLNLLSNAVKFTHQGAIDFAVNMTSSDDQKIVLAFSIKDTGVGISASQHSLVFERFNRLTSAYSGVYAGKGLGLRLVKQFVDELGGEVQVDSQEGCGSTFTVLIPYRRPVA